MTELTKAHIGLVDEKMRTMRPPTFLQSFFSTRVLSYAPKTVSIDITKGNNKIIRNVASLKDTENQRAGEYRSQEYTPFNFNIESVVDEDQFFIRQAGNTEYDINSLMTLTDLAAEQQATAIVRQKTTIEKFCADILTTGTLTSLIPGVENINYGLLASHNITVGTTWSNANADIEANLEAACILVRKDAKVLPKIMLCGADALRYLWRNERFKTQLTQEHNMTLTRLYQRNPNTGAVYHGMITVGSYQLEVWSYPEFYEAHDTTTQSPFIPDDKVIILPENPNFLMVYTAIPNLAVGTSNLGGLQVLNSISSMGMVRGTFIPDIRLDTQRQAIIARVRSRVVPIAASINDIVVLDVAP